MLLGSKIETEKQFAFDIFLVTLGEKAYEKGFALLQFLRAEGLRAMMDHEGRSMKNQLKQADRQNSHFALILGEDELEKGEAALKDMHSGEQVLIELPAAVGNWAATIAAKINQL